MSVNNHQYWFFYIQLLSVGLYQDYQVRESHCNCLLFLNKLILVLFGVHVLSLLVPSHLEVSKRKTKYSVKTTLQTRHWIPSSYVNSTVLCDIYL